MLGGAESERCRVNKRVRGPRVHRDLSVIFGRVSDVKEIVSESRFERADALRMRNSARGSSRNPRACVSRGLLSLFRVRAGGQDLSCRSLTLRL